MANIPLTLVVDYASIMVKVSATYRLEVVPILIFSTILLHIMHYLHNIKACKKILLYKTSTKKNRHSVG